MAPHSNTLAWKIPWTEEPGFGIHEHISILEGGGLFPYRFFQCIQLEKAMAPHSSTLAWKIHGQRSLVGCSPWGLEELDTTERFHFHFSLSCIGEGNGNPLQCSCLENPRDGGAWWVAIYGVAQSRTRLKRLSSSSSSKYLSRIQCGVRWCVIIKK